jgi:serine/threonine protein kinase
MTSEFHARVEQLFAEIWEIEPSERAGRLASADVPSHVREEVRSLLEYHERAKVRDVLQAVHQKVWATLADVPAEPVPPLRWCRDLEAVPGYHLVGDEPLDGGGQGEVWEATAPGKVPVALKRVQLTHKLARDEERAMRLLRGLDRHPHLLDIHGCWKRDSELVIAMELASGTLKDRLARCPGGIPVDELLSHLRDAAEGLDHLHKPLHLLGNDRGAILHRDVKPSNLLVVGGRVKLGDYGLSKASREWLNSHSGGVTPGYEAPECREGMATPQSDQYSLAITYVELRTGRKPHQFDWTRPLLDDPKEWAVIKRALAASPRERWPGCVSFVQHLEDCRKPTRLHARWAAVGLLAAALLIAPLAVFFRPGGPAGECDDCFSEQLLPERPPREEIEKKPSVSPDEVTFLCRNNTGRSLKLVFYNFSWDNEGKGKDVGLAAADKGPWTCCPFPAQTDPERYEQFKQGTGWYALRHCQEIT